MTIAPPPAASVPAATAPLAAPAPVRLTPPPPPITAAPSLPATPDPVMVEEEPAEVAPATPVRRPAPTRARTAPQAVTEPVPAPVAEPVAAVPAPPPAVEAPVAAEPAPLPEATTPAEETAPPQEGGIGFLPWALIAGAVILGAIAFMLRRRRRAEEELHYDETYAEPVAVAEPEPFVTPAAAAPLAAVGPELGRPAIELMMRPVRAGVDEDEARVEFELTVDNHGSAPARDVEVSTWMIPAGSASSDMERMLIERPADATLSEVEPGDAQRIESSVALPTSGLADDSVLPVVVAEARYRLSDGTEARTSASFAVGVPLDGELAHFDLEHPSGMHDDVEARPLEERELA